MSAIALLNDVHLRILQDWRSPARFGADGSIISWIGGKGDRSVPAGQLLSEAIALSIMLLLNRAIALLVGRQ